MADIYRVRTIWTGPTGSPYLSTHFFEGDGTFSSTAATAANTKVRNYWNVLLPSISSALNIAVDPVIDYLDEETGALLNSFATTTFTGAGTATGDLLPLTSQGVMRLETGQVRNGKRVRGKTYVPGPVEPNNVAGAPTASYISTLGTAGAALFSPTTSPNICVWHRPVNGAGGEAIVALSAVGLGYWGSLRSRRDS